MRPEDEALLAILQRVASNNPPGISLGTTNVTAALQRLKILINEHGLNDIIMLKSSMSPMELYILNKERKEDAEDSF